MVVASVSSPVHETPIVRAKERGDEDENRPTSTEEILSAEEMEDQELLRRCGFGLGMSMYARSVALAALAEQEQAELKKTEPKYALAVRSFETVKSELGKKVARQSRDNDDIFEVPTSSADDDSVFSIMSALDLGACCQESEAALVELFRQAEVFSAARDSFLKEVDSMAKSHDVTVKEKDEAPR